VAFAFGKSIGNILDPRPLGHVTISIVLVIFSGITLRRGPDNQRVSLRAATTVNQGE
jgi:hypothetical protein